MTRTRLGTKVLVGVTVAALLGCSGLGLDEPAGASALQRVLSAYGVDVADADGDDLVACAAKGTLTAKEMGRIREELDRLMEDGLSDEDQEALRVYAERLIEE